jgi:hypothetical protein
LTQKQRISAQTTTIALVLVIIDEWYLEISELGDQCYHFYVNKSKGPFLTSPLGANFDPRGEVVHLGMNEEVSIPSKGQISPWGPSSPLGVKFVPGVQG